MPGRSLENPAASMPTPMEPGVLCSPFYACKYTSCVPPARDMRNPAALCSRLSLQPLRHIRVDGCVLPSGGGYRQHIVEVCASSLPQCTSAFHFYLLYLFLGFGLASVATACHTLTVIFSSHGAHSRSASSMLRLCSLNFLC